MTALDDALNNSSVTFTQHQLWAYWRELGKGEVGNILDPLDDLTNQFTGSATIEHSLDDGLPDGVSMSGGNGAAGSLVAGLNGRDGLVLASSGYRPYDGTGGNWRSAGATKTITVPVPNTVTVGDYLISCVVVNDSTTTLAQVVNDPKDQWKLLGSAIDAPLAMYVYGKPRWNATLPSLTLQSSNNTDYMSSTVAVWARNPNNIPLDYLVTDLTVSAEPTSTATHTVSSRIYNKGYQIGFFGSATTVSTFTPVSPLVYLGDPALNNLVVTSGITPLRSAGVYSISATQTAANAVVVKAAISLEPYERPSMDGRQYFSAFNKNSPLYGLSRDTASTLFTFNVLTANGTVGTVLHNGVMADTPVKGRQAELQSVSRTRIDLNANVKLPVVYGYREGCTTDWLASWLLSRGGKYVGPAPTVYTKAWAPLHGSVHAHIGNPYTYNYALIYNASGGWYGYKNPQSVAGPFLSGMYAEQTSTRAIELKLNFIKADLNYHDLPRYQVDSQQGYTRPVYPDVFSKLSSKGRITFWLRGDAVQAAPSYLPSSEDFIFNFYQYITDNSGNYAGYVRVGVASNTRNIQVQIGSANAGYSQYEYTATGALNTTGAWDFYGVHWDFALGKVDLVHNGTEVHTTSFATDGRNVITQLPDTDAQGRFLGYSSVTQVRSHVPLSEFMFDVGIPYYTGQWANWYSTPASPGSSVVTRPTLQWLQAIAEPNPVVLWDALADVARSTLSAYRANEDDYYELLPLSYFGETAQMTSQAIQDTQTNAQDLDVTVDSSKLRNVVSVQFPETSVTTNITSVLKVSQAYTVPVGLTTQTFTLDVLAAEIHGQSQPFAAWWTLTNLTITQIYAPSIPANTHYITVNTAADGTGTTLAASQVTATIISAEAGTITLQFNNRTGVVAYLTNNGVDVPFLQILGYAVEVNDGYVTQRDANSVLLRRERGLATELPWVQDRTVANNLAMLIAVVTSRPRAEVNVTVMGDPRRRPGQLVTIKDSEGTGVSGTWRILSVGHNIDGAEYTQDLSLVYVGNVLTWDDTTTAWDDSVWGP